MLMDKALIASFSGKPMLKKKKIVLDHYSIINIYIYIYNYYLSIIYPSDSQSDAQQRTIYATKIIQIIKSFPDFNEFKLRKSVPDILNSRRDLQSILPTLLPILISC